MLPTIVQVSGEETASSSVQVQPVCPEQVPPVPEDVKIVHEAHATESAAEDSQVLRLSSLLNPPHSSATGGDGAGDEGLDVELFYRGGELEEVLFKELRLLFGDVVGSFCINKQR